MSQSDEKFSAIAAQIKKGVAPQRETARSFLLWFGSERRGYRVVRRIRSALKRYGLTTSPDFEYAYIDGFISFVKAPADTEVGGVESGTAIADPTYRIGRLESANKTPTSIKPDATLQQAITLTLPLENTSISLNRKNTGRNYALKSTVPSSWLDLIMCEKSVMMSCTSNLTVWTRATCISSESLRNS